MVHALKKRGRAAQNPAKRKQAARDLSGWMRMLLAARRMSIQELARRTGRNRTDISRSLSGKHDWEFARIRDYAAALLLEPKDIVTIGETYVDAFSTIYRPIIEWAMVRPHDLGLSITPKILGFSAWKPAETRVARLLRLATA